MLKKLKKKMKKSVAVSTAAAFILSGALQTGVSVVTAAAPTSVELVAAQNGTLDVAQGTTINFDIQLKANDSNINAQVQANTQYYIKGQNASVSSDTLSTTKYKLNNGNDVARIPVSVTVDSNVRTGSVQVPITVEVTNNGNNSNTVVDKVTDYFTVNVVSADTTAPVVTISSPVNNGYYKSDTLPANPVYDVVEANQHTETVTGWDKTEGTHKVTVTSTDASGNAGSASATYTVDNTPPSISSTIVDGGIYNGDTLRGLGNFYSVQDANPGTDSATPLVYTEGDYTTDITATDKAGNTATKTIHYTVDNTAPSISFKFNDNGIYKSSALSALNPYYNVTDAHLAPNGINAPALDLREGNGNVTVSATDLAGNTNSASASFIVDDTAPEVSIKLDSSKYYNKASLIALGDYYEATDLHLDTVDASSLEMDEDGTYQATVSAVDFADNRTTVTRSYTVDNTAPEIKFNEKLVNGGFYKSSALESIKDSFFTATDAHLKSKSDLQLDLTEGTHTVKVQANDEAGNQTEESITYTIDNTAPKVSFNFPNNSFFTSQALESLLNGENYYSTSDNNATVSVVAEALSYEESEHTLTVVAKDAAGNETEKSVTYTIDNTAPVISFTDNQTFILGQTATISWAASDANLQSPASGNVPVETTKVGLNTVTVSATDKAGNTKKETIHYNVVYKFGGVLQPINSNGASIFKAGSTIPVKFQLTNAQGALVSSANATISLKKLTNAVLGTTYEDVPVNSTPNAGDTFRYDFSANQYIFNLSTKGLSSGSYIVTIDLHDGSVPQSVGFSLK
ncbi:PxKF domain-containing protein [Bacillus salipaludis]|uniref:PxKF domain-containing protein n=1 Tax=Bacillus salipaludis TaxID=2547811 RepID=UPI002E2206F3|nr:PxKF domain-containing protein [Bacillus salipaludis]